MDSQFIRLSDPRTWSLDVAALRVARFLWAEPYPAMPVAVVAAFALLRAGPFALCARSLLHVCSTGQADCWVGVRCAHRGRLLSAPSLLLAELQAVPRVGRVGHRLRSRSSSKRSMYASRRLRARTNVVRVVICTPWPSLALCSLSVSVLNRVSSSGLSFRFNCCSICSPVVVL